MVENDCEEQGFSSMADGCTACPPKAWKDGRRVNYAIVPRGRWMCCERCGGSYGEVSPTVPGDAPKGEAAHSMAPFTPEWSDADERLHQQQRAQAVPAGERVANQDAPEPGWYWVTGTAIGGRVEPARFHNGHDISLRPHCYCLLPGSMSAVAVDDLRCGVPDDERDKLFRIVAPLAAPVAAAPAGIPTEDGIRWQAGAWPVERKAVTVDGHTWYRADHENVKSQAVPAGQPGPATWKHHCPHTEGVVHLPRSQGHCTNCDQPAPLYAHPPAGTAAAPRLTDEQIEAIAHRASRRYLHISANPNDTSLAVYQFDRPTLLDFARALLSESQP